MSNVMKPKGKREAFLCIWRLNRTLFSELIQTTSFFPPSSLIRASHHILHSLSSLPRIPLRQPPLTRLSHSQSPNPSMLCSPNKGHSHPTRSSCLYLTFPNLPQVSILPCITWDYFRCTITNIITNFNFLTPRGLLFTLHRVILLILQVFHFLWGLAIAIHPIIRAV